jgi:hypothetical protein
MKHLESNSESSVQEHSRHSIEIARTEIPDGQQDGTAMTHVMSLSKERIKKALEALMNLKGVGPATASAILSLVRPDSFAYMYDEAIESCLLKRTYNLSTYLTFNDQCMLVAATLDNGWTARRVARALWTAAKALAYGLHDHTNNLPTQRKATRGLDNKHESKPKRRRTKRA